MSANKNELNKDVINLECICKELLRYIKLRIINNYIVIEKDNISKNININEKSPTIWKYNTQEKVTENDKILNIFKDNTFLAKLKEFYEVLEIIISLLDENRKKFESMKKKLKKQNLLPKLIGPFNPCFIYQSPFPNIQFSNPQIKNIYFSKSFNFLNSLNIVNSSKQLDFNEISPNKKNPLEKYLNLKTKRDNKNDKNADIKEGSINDEKENNTEKLYVNMKNSKDELTQNHIIDSLTDNIKLVNEGLSNKKDTKPTINLNKENNKDIINLNNNNTFNSKDKCEIEFEKLLKNEFSSIYSNKNIPEICKDIILKLEKILNKISQLKFPELINKIDGPFLIGSYKNFKTLYLLNSLPSIDILFKCKDIRCIDEINSITEEILSKKLSLNYDEEKREYDKDSEIVKLSNKCKIAINKINFLCINITLFFVNINISSYNKKEQCLNKYLSINEIYNNKDKILICLFFRRWRRKNQLYFIWPEFLDIIINSYFNEGESFLKIIENIFNDISNEKINLSKKNNNIIEDKENIKEIDEFIKEWYNSPENKNALNNALTSTKECLLNNNFSSLVKTDQ